jgi:hypothetical protein
MSRDIVVSSQKDKANSSGGPRGGRLSIYGRFLKMPGNLSRERAIVFEGSLNGEERLWPALFPSIEGIARTFQKLRKC